MKFDTYSWAVQKERENPAASFQWLKALESARQSLQFMEMDYESLERFAAASRSPEQLTILTRLIYQYGKSNPHGNLISEEILSLVNKSPFSLQDWLGALEFFYRWLERNRRKIDFLSMLNYLECCVASSDAREPGQTLTALVEDMLNFAGYSDRDNPSGLYP